MPYPTFPAINVGESSKKRRGFKVISVDFGDGYTLAVKDGINTDQEEWELNFSQYSKTQINTITQFLDTTGTVTPFFWTPPDESVPKLWRQTGEYSMSFDGPNVRSLSFTIKKVYNI